MNKYVVLNICLLICSILAVELGQIIPGMIALLTMLPVAIAAQYMSRKENKETPI